MNLHQIAVAWRERLRNSQFVGEVSISQEEIDRVAPRILENEALTQGEKDVLLAVIAVNVAYYYYDEQGYWVHFCEKINEQHDNNRTNQIGFEIESSLRNIHFYRTERTGIFRYVGAILEQCGITLRCLPDFVQILNGCIEKYGYELSYYKYKQYTSSQQCSQYLKDYLLDPAGWEFIKDVAKNLRQYKAGVISRESLVNATGYRPGFWAELLSRLNSGRLPSTEINRISRPKLTFNPNDNQLVILFDEEFCRSGTYRFEGVLLIKNPIILNEFENFKESYPYEIQRNGHWVHYDLDGWNPQSQKIALFDIKRGYIANTSYLATGNYYLLIPSSLKSEVSPDLIRGELGYADIPFGNYCVLEIEVCQESELTFLGANVKTSDLKFLSWSGEVNKLNGADDIFEVFTGTLPKIRIEKFEFIRSKSVIVFLDIGRGPRKIEVNQEILELNISAPTKGKIWVESVDRLAEFAGMVVVDSLNFCLLPTCSIDWPNRLLSSTECPEVRLEGSDSVKLALYDCTMLDENGRLWRVPGGKMLIEGTISFANLTVHLSKFIHRATLRSPSIKDPLFLESEDFLERQDLIATGMPFSKIDLLLQLSNTSRYKLNLLGSFDRLGEKRFSTFDIRDATAEIENRMVVGLFKIMAGGREVETAAYYVNTERIKEILLSPQEDQNYEWIALLNHEPAESFKKLISLMQGSQVTISAVSVEKLPKGLQLFAQEMVFCVIYFDKLQVTEGFNFSIESLPGHIKVALEWFKKARDYFNNLTLNETPESLLSELEYIEWRPALQRWKSAFDKLVAQLKDEVELLPLLYEWAEDVKGPGRIQYQNRVTNYLMGTELTLAWRSYFFEQQNNFQHAYKRAYRVCHSCRGLIRDLATLLMTICLYKTKHFDDLSLNPIKNINDRKIKNLLVFIFEKARPSKCLPQLNAKDIEMARALPLREEDSPLFDNECK